jgi:hypothetical protein
VGNCFFLRRAPYFYENVEKIFTTFHEYGDCCIFRSGKVRVTHSQSTS